MNRGEIKRLYEVSGLVLNRVKDQELISLLLSTLLVFSHISWSLNVVRAPLNQAVFSLLIAYKHT